MASTASKRSKKGRDKSSGLQKYIDNFQLGDLVQAVICEMEVSDLLAEQKQDSDILDSLKNNSSFESVKDAVVHIHSLNEHFDRVVEKSPAELLKSESLRGELLGMIDGTLGELTDLLAEGHSWTKDARKDLVQMQALLQAIPEIDSSFGKQLESIDNDSTLSDADKAVRKQSVETFHVQAKSQIYSKFGELVHDADSQLESIAPLLDSESQKGSLAHTRDELLSLQEELRNLKSEGVKTFLLPELRDQLMELAEKGMKTFAELLAAGDVEARESHIALNRLKRSVQAFPQAQLMLEQHILEIQNNPEYCGLTRSILLESARNQLEALRASMVVDLSEMLEVCVARLNMV